MIHLQTDLLCHCLTTVHTGTPPWVSSLMFQQFCLPCPLVHLRRLSTVSPEALCPRLAPPHASSSQPGTYFMNTNLWTDSSLCPHQSWAYTVTTFLLSLLALPSAARSLCDNRALSLSLCASSLLFLSLSFSWLLSLCLCLSDSCSHSLS